MKDKLFSTISTTDCNMLNKTDFVLTQTLFGKFSDLKSNY